MLRHITIITKLNTMLALLFLAIVGLGFYGLDAQQQAHQQAQHGLRVLKELEGSAGAPERMAQWADQEGVRLSRLQQQQRAEALAVVGVFLVGVGGLGLVLRFTIRQGMLRSISAATRVIGRVGEGDLTARVDIPAHGESKDMLQGLDRMAADLGRLVSAVARGAHAVSGASAQIAQGYRNLSQRTEEQATSLEETAGAMEELTTTVARNAQSAREAEALARHASEVASRGGEAVGRVVATMGGITESSRRIVEIIGFIDGLALQTNILAFNAAVEAARAGEHGRGFAAVAVEVRTLAQRSAVAATQIKTLIQESVQKVDVGRELAASAGLTMEEIVDSARKVSQLIAEIAAASQEQSAGIEQVNSAVAQMEQVVQQNACLVEEAAAVTHSMTAEADMQLQMVERFQLGEAVDEGDGGPPAALLPSDPRLGSSVSPPARRGAAPGVRFADSAWHQTSSP